MFYLTILLNSKVILHQL